MRIVSIGGGPAGLFFAILMRKRFPATQVVVFERNREGDTFGWGVVFSRETLSIIAAADPESYAEIERSFAYWDDIETYHAGAKTVSTGHGFCGLARKRLLAILEARATALGVDIRFQSEIPDPEMLREKTGFDADLVLGADGVNSLVRQRYATTFKPDIHWGRARFCWLGTTLPLRAFTFHFKRSEHGLFQIHAYPFQEGLSTWIVETSEETWRRAGLDKASEEETVAYCEKLFREELAGHPLLTNRSIWRSFPTIRCEKWSHGNLVLMGDAVHTAHFSIGSGTKLAMEDAIVLADQFTKLGTADVPAALAAYETARRPEVERLQRAAQVSREWFEDCERWAGQGATQFTFNLMTRSHRITWDNLAARDPKLVRDTAAWFAAANGVAASEGRESPPPAFVPFELCGMRFANRLVMSPMCQYTAKDGVPSDWHLVHLGSRALGGTGLIIAEMTNVSPEGRISRGCTGIWNDEQEHAWRRIVEFVHGNSPAKIGLQLGHAGRKGSCGHSWDAMQDPPLAPDDGAWETLAPSAVPYDEAPGSLWHTPRAMTRADMDRVTAQYAAATARAARAGFDVLELHAAHGYLLATFLSPLSNRRTDEYGGSLSNRLRYPLEVLRAVRAAWPKDRPLFVRISAADWVAGGNQPEDGVAIAAAMHEAGADLIDVSSGGVTPASRPSFGRLYNAAFADRVRHDAKVPVMTVGGVFDVNHANTILAAGRCDLVALARPHLGDPYLAARAAAKYGCESFWPGPYLASRPK